MTHLPPEHLDGAHAEQIEAYACDRAIRWLDRAISTVTDAASVTKLIALREECRGELRGHREAEHVLRSPDEQPACGVCDERHPRWDMERREEPGVRGGMVCRWCAADLDEQRDAVAAEE